MNNQDSIEERGYTLAEFFYILKSHYKKILYIFCLVFFISLYYTFSSNPTYRSTSIIMVDKEQNSMSFLDMNLSSERNFIENEMEILKSRTISEMVIKKLVNSKYKDSLYCLGTQVDNSIFKLFNNTEKKDLLINDKFISSKSKQLKRSISISSNRNTDAISISVESKSADEASIIANTIVDVYIDSDLDWTVSEMTHLKSFLVQQIQDKEIELKNIENELKIFQEREKVFSLEGNSGLILQRLSSFESEYNNILASISIVKERESYLNEQLTNEERYIIEKASNTINDRLIALKNEIANLETELITLNTKYDKEHSAIQNINSKLKKAKDDIELETKKLIESEKTVLNPLVYRQSLIDSLISIKSIKSGLTSKSKAFKKLVNEYDNKLGSLSGKLLEFSTLERNRNIHAETYSFMRQKLEEARIGEASKLSNIRVIDKAIPNYNPVKPNKIINIIVGFILGISAGVGLVFIIEIFDNAVKSVEQVERRGLAILSLIPAIASENGKKVKTKKYLRNNNISKMQRRLITHEDPKSPISESYRSLRTSLMYTKAKSECNVILVSSAGPGEGKTTTVANLAITYANLGKKTLLIDSDLRKPIIHNVFNKSKDSGLTSYLVGDKKINEIINHTDIPNLDIITSGVIPPNPSELLDSKMMDTLFDKIKKDYDIILFDTPPLIAVTDAYVLLKRVDQFILVIRAGITHRAALDRVISSMNHANFDITGVVMNAMTEKHTYGSGYYYSYYQTYYAEK